MNGSRLLRIAAVAALGFWLMAAGVGCAPDAASTPAPKKGGRGPHLVETEVATRRALRLTQVHTGSLRARRVVRIHTQESGRIIALPFFEGDRVAAGDVLLTLDDTLLATGLTRARAMRREAESNLGRLERLVKSRMVAEEDVLRARTALDVARADEALLRTRLGYTRITAPFDGLVSERRAEPGDIAEQYDHVLTVLDPASLVADLEVSELLMPHIDAGTTVTVRIDALGDGSFPGRVIRVYPELDPLTRQGRVEVELVPPPPGSRSGQFARVTFELEALERLVIPFASLRRDEDGEFVFRMQSDGRVERVPVRSGQRLADRVEILEGLASGDRVVKKGFLGLKPDLMVKIVGTSDR